MEKQHISLTADSAVLTRENNKIRVLLVRRGNDPYKGQWALPGGFLKDEETLEAGAKRELEEETGLKVEKMRQIKAYGKPDRDPRGRTVSIAFWTEIPTAKKVKGNDDAAEAEWFELDQLPPLAFDHHQILKDAVEQLRSSK